MIALLQRVSHASVTVDNRTVSAIDHGLLVFLGVEKTDSRAQAEKMAKRLLAYRLFEDDAQKMNLSVSEINGSVLIVPQFTLAADTNTGNRPSFSSAASPGDASALYEHCINTAKSLHPNIAQGSFQSHMHVTLCNDGPVTFILKT